MKNKQLSEKRIPKAQVLVEPKINTKKSASPQQTISVKELPEIVCDKQCFDEVDSVRWRRPT
jgi:hypothetical protein